MCALAGRAVRRPGALALHPGPAAGAGQGPALEKVRRFRGLLLENVTFNIPAGSPAGLYESEALRPGCPARSAAVSPAGLELHCGR